MSRHNVLLTLSILLAITLATVSFYIERQQIRSVEYWQTSGQETIADASPQITPEDRAPLPIPPNVIRQGKALRLPILMYHHIGTMPPVKHDPLRLSLTVSPQDFERQVAWVKSQGYVSVSLADIYAYSQGKKTLPKKPIAFTFDDGYDDALINAPPILEKYGYTGSFAIITGWPGWQNGTNSYASWDQIKQAQDSGMEIVCHTQNHFDGSSQKFNAQYIFNNLEGCQQDLKNHLGQAEPILVYPYGHYTVAYVVQAVKAGFRMGITVHEGDVINLDDLMQIPRVRVQGQEDFARFKKVLSE